MDILSSTSPFLRDYDHHSFDVRLAEEIGLNEAILLQQLHDIAKVSQNVRKDASGQMCQWVPVRLLKKALVYWSPQVVSRLLDTLQEDGLIVQDTFGEQHVYVAINYQGLNQIHMSKYLPASQEQSPIFDDGQPTDEEIGIFTDGHKRPTGNVQEKVVVDKKGKILASHPMVKAIIGWWTSPKDGFPNGGKLTLAEAGMAKQVAMKCISQGWAEAQAVEYLQAAYRYYLQDKYLKGKIHIGSMGRLVVQWYAQVREKPIEEIVHEGYRPVMPKRNK